MSISAFRISVQAEFHLLAEAEMTDELNGKIALVTGASRGIGRAIAPPEAP